MTRKHFNRLAEDLRFSHPADTTNDSAKAHKVWAECVTAVADSCAYFNRAFDRDRFYTACAPEGATLPF